MRVKDGTRELEFEGTLLGAASSKTPGSLRWIEIYIYATDSGKYVISKVGRSTVFHDLAKRCGKGTKTMPLDLPEGATPCPKCSPPRLPFTAVELEADRFSAHVLTTPAGIIEQLHNTDAEGTVYMTRTARHALEQAALNDQEIADAYAVQRI
jgi:hypothetical protein